MKKLLYIFTFLLVLAISTTGCTDENVQPNNNEAPPTMGGTTDPKG